MDKIPVVQSEWLKKHFELTEKDWPSEFWEPKDICKILIGEYSFRGLDYEGNSDSFSDECGFSLADHRNKDKIYGICVHFAFLMEKCKTLEFYELLSNFKEMLENFEYAFRALKNQDEDEQLYYLLVDAGIIEDGGDPFLNDR